MLCGSAPPVALAWVEVEPDADWVSTHSVAGYALPPLTLKNRSTESRNVALSIRLSGNGESVKLENVAEVMVASESSATLALALPDSLETELAAAEFSAKVQILADYVEPTDSASHYVSPALYCHLDLSEDKLVVYDGAGLVERHLAGDLAGSHVGKLPAGAAANMTRIARGVAVAGEPPAEDTP